MRAFITFLCVVIGFAACDLSVFLANLIRGRSAELRLWLTCAGAFCVGLLLGSL